MPIIKQLSRVVTRRTKEGPQSINWFPGHMFSGMQAMIGKLNTIDCVVEVHDARIPFTGRNVEFRRHLGTIKPHLLVLNKRDLADLTNWDRIKKRLADRGDHNVILTNLTGSEYAAKERGYDQLLDSVVNVINESDRLNRQKMKEFKIMIVGIPNVGKSTLINRLRQRHIGIRGEPARSGSQAGVTRHVENIIKICSRPPIYSIDTPGVLVPKVTRDVDKGMLLALCATISDKVLNPEDLAAYLLDYLNLRNNDSYLHSFGLENPPKNVKEFVEGVGRAELLKAQDGNYNDVRSNVIKKSSPLKIYWKFVREFREGKYGKVMFER